MSASTLDIRWSKQGKSEIPLVSFRSETVSSRTGVHLHEQRCPACDSIVYSRRHSRCGVCEEVLPSSLLFTRNEADRVDELLKIERQRHRSWMMRIQYVKQ